jgi:hypothetical protein
MWFGQGLTRYAPPNEGGPLLETKSRTNTCHPYNQTCFTLLKRCQRLKHGQILTLDWMACEWNLLDTLCKKVHHTSTTKINAHKKVKKSMIIQNPTFFNPKFMCSTTHHFGFGYWHSLVWNLDFEWLNFEVCWLQLGVSAKDLLIIITSMSAHRGFVFNLQWCSLIPHHCDLIMFVFFYTWFLTLGSSWLFLAPSFYWFMILIIFILLYFLVPSSNVSF